MKVLPIVLFLSLLSTPVYAIEICSGPNRAARKVTCLVDGDTGWQNGKKWRLLDVDTPEISRSECKAEGMTGKAALNRLAALMTDGYQLQYSGSKDRTSDRRDLVRIKLHDGRDAGEVLIQERLAQPWPNTGNIWCNR